MIPADASGKKVAQFKAWLASQGLESRPATNQYEVFRFVSKLGTMVLYLGGRGYSVNCQLVHDAWKHFVAGENLPWRGAPGKRFKGSKIKRALIDRDGYACFYCGRTVPEQLTQEHLLAIVHGGQSRLENMVMACRPCNLEAGHLPVADKVLLRDRKREELLVPRLLAALARCGS